MIKRIIFLLLICSTIFSCKKGSSDKKNNNARIKSINDGSSAQIFEYDAEGRITRVYYNASYSKKFTYSPAGVNIQVLGSGDIPDPDRKYDFTIVNGRITSGTEYQANQKIIKSNYGYDDEGKMTFVYFTINSGNTLYESHTYLLTYNAQNNVEHIGFLRKALNGNTLENSDSVSITKAYWTTKFVTWADLGFDYFGKASFGQEHLGYGIVVPFQLASLIYPGNNALKGYSISRYSWNPVTKKWNNSGGSSGHTGETIYGYDGTGRLISYYGQTIEWQ